MKKMEEEKFEKCKRCIEMFSSFDTLLNASYDYAFREDYDELARSAIDVASPAWRMFGEKCIDEATYEEVRESCVELRRAAEAKNHSEVDATLAKLGSKRDEILKQVAKGCVCEGG